MWTRSSAARCFIRRNMFSLVLFAMALIFVSTTANFANAQTFTLLHMFTGSPDGANPFGGLVADRNGNYYGTTEYGGVHNYGSIFELSPPALSGGAWTEAVIWSFAGGADGSYPSFQLVMDGGGRLYGETQGGGSAACGCGTVFELAPPKESGGNWAKRVIYTLTSGDHPYGGVILDSGGSVYGTQVHGGTFGLGQAFKLSPNANRSFTETTLYNFGATHADSKQPFGPLNMDSSGNLYGVSLYGGMRNLGTVYRLTPPASGTGSWSNSILRTFIGGASGCSPEGNLILDSLGRLYGTATGCGGVADNGVIFQLTPPTGSGPWVESVLHTFGATDGGGAYPSLSLDTKAEVFYGTSYYGGLYGVVFKLAPPAAAGEAWSESVLHTFTGGVDGAGPLGPIVWDANGVLYGTGFEAAGKGVAFSITP